jgi:hypothetical protein
VQGARGQFTVNYRALAFSDEFDRVRDVYGELFDAAMAGALFTAATTLAVYPDMAITNFAVPRNAANGNAIQFQVDFQQLRIVDTQVVETPAGKAKPNHKGSKPTKDASDKQATDNRTVALKLLNLAGVKL